MAAASDSKTRLLNIAANLESELEVETQARLAAQAAGLGVKTSYSIDGESVDWNSYLATMLQRIREAREMAAAEDLYELHQQMFT